MRCGNISIFIPHMGCPNACSFCSQRTISSTVRAPSPGEAEDIIKEAYERIPEDKRAQTEIAFFGGSFTAIDRGYMTALLEAAHKYVRNAERGGFGGIRISTRPDCIDEEILMLLKEYGVTAIELGAQSMRDRVLLMNSRGHTARDVREASVMIKDFGFELGLQMMTGLYGSSPEDDLYTAGEIIKLRPDTARIYPTAVLKGTRLAELYEAGEYVPYPFDECVRVCAGIYRSFTEKGIRVIRMGLHAQDGVEENALAGYYHPAFGELVYSELIRQMIESALDGAGKAVCEAPPRLMSALSGHKRSNRIYFADKNVSFAQSGDIPDGAVRINGIIYNIFR